MLRPRRGPSSTRVYARLAFKLEFPLIKTRLSLVASTTAVLAISLSASAQSVVTGPSSSASPYVRPFNNYPVDVVSILTVGDTVNNKPNGAPYYLVGIPDGMGAYMNQDGTMTLLVAHELATNNGGGVPRAHHPAGFSNGAFTSQWKINVASGPDFLRVLHGEDMMNSLQTVTNGSGGSLYTIQRFCSADLAEVSGLFNPATGLGTTERIFLSGEEASGAGRVVGTGINERIGVELLPFNTLVGAWENICVRPLASDKTIVVALSDGNANRVFVYEGTKQSTGSIMNKAGLTNGIGYGVQVQVNGTNIASESRELCFNSAGKPRFSGTFTLVPGNAGTSFLRPEDGAWDPANPADFYFVTTDRIHTIGYGGTQLGSSRLFRMRFNDINNVLAGGTIEALLDGTDVMNMGDNLTVYNDLQGGTRVLISEDPGNSPQNAKTLLYTVATDTLDIVLESDRARFGDWGGVAATAPFNQDEENSGVIDAREMLGLGWFIQNMQSHYGITGELVQGGQLYAFYCPACVGSSMADLSPTLDGIVGGDDIAVLLGNWGGTGRSDINRDGTTNGEDLTALLASWNAN